MSELKNSSEAVRSLTDIYEILNSPSNFAILMGSLKQLEEEAKKGNQKAKWTLQTMYQFELFIKFITKA